MSAITKMGFDSLCNKKVEFAWWTNLIGFVAINMDHPVSFLVGMPVLYIPFLYFALGENE